MREEREINYTTFYINFDELKKSPSSIVLLSMKITCTDIKIGTVATILFELLYDDAKIL